MSISPNFPIDRDGQAHTALTTGSVLALTGADVVTSTDVMIENPGPNVVRVRAGGAGVAASALSMRVPPGTQQPFNKGAATHLGFLAEGANQAVIVFVGEGS